jgi:ABC-type multidrug transport system fused ATPase/permease subunit
MLNKLSEQSSSPHLRPGFIGFVQAILYLFPGRERRLLAGAVITCLVSSIFETVGIASIFPFMSVILDPTVIDRYPSLHTITAAFGATTRNRELVVLGSGLALLFVLGNSVGAFNAYIQERLASRTSARLATELFANYMKQTLGFHVQRDSASLLKVLFEDVSNVRNNILPPVLYSFARISLVLLIIGVLLVRDPYTAIGAALLLGAAYATVFRGIQTGLRRKGERYHNSNEARIRIAQESLGGIRELKALCREDMPIEGFAALSTQASRDEAASRVVQVLPRYIFETIAFGGILLGAIWLITHSAEPSLVVPTMALYVFAGYKLMPALQQIFASAVQIRFSLRAFNSVYEDLKKLKGEPANSVDHALGELDQEKSITFSREVRLEDVSYWHDKKEAPSLCDVGLRLRAKESVGFVGRTGAGKSTLADLLLGFYEPTYGSIYIDDVKLSAANVRSWRRKLGYVPQQIFLANASVADNIGFGLRRSAIDICAVHTAAALAQAEEFIMELPQQYETIIGERGVKLSGGQRQRIGIARALYTGPELLILDEATSALDGLTEEAVMEAIAALSTKLTIILIAHRLRTVQACDRIILLEKGRVVADGAYDQLMKTSEPFYRLVMAGRDPAKGDPV